MIPQLMGRIWTGSVGEHFTHRDMGRVEYNINAIAEALGISPVEFRETTRASQFFHDDAQRIEDLIAESAEAAGVEIDVERSWNHGRTVSFVDFERWESSMWTVYRAIGGIGERIPSDRRLVNYHAMLFSSGWVGTGPYHIDLKMPGIHPNTEVLTFVSHQASVSQRQAEINAILRAAPLGDRMVRVEALAIRPDEDIPITMAIGGLQMHTILNLTAQGWTGTGPWTQDVTVPANAVEAVIGQWEGMTSDAVLQMANARLHVSAINGTTVTVRAIGRKPTMDLNPALLYDVENTEAA